MSPWLSTADTPPHGDRHRDGGRVPGTPLAFAQQADASGEVRRVDPAAGKVTIKHDAIKALDLPAMTLVYEADPALLAKIKAGDKVKFTAERKDGKYVVTAISN